jgi:hypothetical protein
MHCMASMAIYFLREPIPLAVQVHDFVIAANTRAGARVRAVVAIVEVDFRSSSGDWRSETIRYTESKGLATTMKQRERTRR